MKSTISIRGLISLPVTLSVALVILPPSYLQSRIKSQKEIRLRNCTNTGFKIRRPYCVDTTEQFNSSLLFSTIKGA